MSRKTLLTGIAVATFALWAGSLLAGSFGVSGKAQSATGCVCHDPAPNANGAITVSITGPQVVRPESTHSYTITVIGSPAGTAGGFDLFSTGGTFIPGLGTHILNGDLVHSDPTRRTWTFDWQAPSAEGTANWYAVGIGADGTSDETGDSWNWFGNAVNTPFTIMVSSQTPTKPRSWGHLKSLYR